MEHFEEWVDDNGDEAMELEVTPSLPADDKAVAKARIYAPHPPEEEKLEVVVKEMRDWGAPTLRAVRIGLEYFALEGSHRLAAAHKLGVIPILSMLRPEDTLPTDLEVLAPNGSPLPNNTVGDVVSHLSKITFYEFSDEFEDLLLNDVTN
jgi:hypothetical protein